ncbi:peroxiredoxin [Intrasporangium sp.]|uniref:peroxiredoxin n=1 Tax=Intrasporangium sp. TaxID=1925024 RepID=UPI00293A2150|nr:peroxiredoxin [Intrasporangium sp.]MDV3222531.1 peroxiredoxin [Intrasporangium sp.]
MTPAPSKSEARSPRVGELAPDFTLVDQHGVDVTLSSVRGAKFAAVVFYPFAFSGICTGELREIRDGLEDFQDGDVQVFTISCDAMYSLRAWADLEGHFFPLLSDHWPHGEVARRYGVFNEDQGAPLRATFLVDRDGLVAWSEVNGPGEGRDFVSYRAALASLRERTR